MKAGRGLFLIVLILGAVGPLYFLLKVSVSPPAEVMTPHPLLLPHAITWRFWDRVLASGQLTAPCGRASVWVRDHRVASRDRRKS